MNYHMSVKTELEKIAKNHDLRIGGSIINEANLFVLDGSNYRQIPTQPGCYFIFSTLEESDIHTWSDYQFYNNSLIHKGGRNYRCIYNGTIGSKGLRQRVAEHLVNSATISRAMANPSACKLCTTGSMSLEGIKQQDWDQLFNSNNFLRTAVQHFQDPRKLPASSKVRYDDMYRLANGINITEPRWAEHKFAVITLTFDVPDFRKFVEHPFRSVNGGGKPPLCNK